MKFDTTTDDTINILKQRNQAKIAYKHNPNLNRKEEPYQLNTSYQNDKVIHLEDKLE